MRKQSNKSNKSSKSKDKSTRRLRAAGIRQHEADVMYFAAHPYAVWRVRRRVAGEMVTDDGVDQHPGATHLLVLTDLRRIQFAATPLALPADASDADARAAAVLALRQLVDDADWERMG